MNVFDAFYILLLFLYSIVEWPFTLFIKPKRKKITGQLVFVTGAGRGIGQQFAVEFAKLGARIAICDIDEKSCEETVTKIKEEMGTEAKAYKCDVRSRIEVRKVAAQVIQQQGHVDILVNNAGVLKCKNILDLTEDDITQTIDVNLLAHFWTIQAFLPKMMEQNFGHVVSVASVAGKIGSPLLSDYAASKHGVCGLTESLEREMRVYGKTGVKFTQVCPLFTDTALVRDLLHRIKVNCGLDKRLLTTQEVVSGAINGILCEERVVFIPKNAANLSFFSAILPTRVIDALDKTLNIGFEEIDKKED